jgi:hypothetical protein
MKRGATLLIVAICLLASVLLAVFYERTTPLRHMDSVFLFESSLNVLESGHPTSSTWESYVPEVYATFTLPADEVCSLELRKEPAGGYNILDNHAYMAIYPISVLTAVAGPEGTFAILNALAHVLLVVIPCVFLVRQGAGVLAAAAFALLVAVYPVWSYSATGDYYLDRLYMPFALLSLFTMHLMIMNQERLRDARWLGAWVAATVAAALFTERAALMMIGVIGFFLIFFPAVRRSATALATMLTLGLVLATYLLWYFTAVQSPDTSISLLGSINTVILAERLQSPEMIAFISVNLLFMGLLVVLAGFRYTLLVLCVMLPNILITVGGAELNGWTTHYHAMYLPFTVFAAAIGFLRLTRGDRPRVLRAAVAAGVVAYALLLGGSMDPYTGGRDSQFSASLRNGIVYRVWKHYTDQADWYTNLAHVARSLDAIVPQGAQISAVEGAMPALYRGRSISMYPMNMDTADYLVVPGIASEGRVVSLSGAISYLGPEVAKSLNECLLERATAQGFQLWRELGAGDLIVLRRDGTETSEA